MFAFALCLSLLSCVLSGVALLLMRRTLRMARDLAVLLAEAAIREEAGDALQSLGMERGIVFTDALNGLDLVTLDAVGPLAPTVDEDSPPPEDGSERYEIARALWIANGRQGPPPRREGGA